MKYSPETRMFYGTVWGHADGVLFMRGRPHFHYVDGRRAAANSGAPIALVAYGASNLEALQRRGLGFTVVGFNVEVSRDAGTPAARLDRQVRALGKRSREGLPCTKN